MDQDLQIKFNDKRHGLYFVGTTPPKASTDDNTMNDIADKLLGRLAHLDVDGLIVYDIQDESSRTDLPRPFPFVGTRDPRAYSALLQQKSGCPVITYKSVSQRNADEFAAWLEEAWNDYGVRQVVLVGSPSSRNAEIKLSLNDAYARLAASPQNFSLGGVTIAERHASKRNEHKRLLNKMEQGCNFFISQAVYDASATVSLLRDYARLCREQGTEPQRLILTFTPCGSVKTLEFMQWLGISVPRKTADQIIGAANPLSESIRICRQNLDTILDASLSLGIPLGLNIESLTNRKEEIEASIRLFKLLKATLEERTSAHYQAA